jgi:hypothetical protein
MRRKNTILMIVTFLFCLVSQVQGGPIYFLVAEPNRIVHGDSYVLPLTEPNDITHARNLITYGPSAGQPIVVASITCSPDCINPWSWHVTKFEAFADITAEILDGWPTYVEGHCNEVPKQIGFWSYTVVRELGPYPRHFNGDIDDDNDVDFMDFGWFGDEWQTIGCQAPDWCGGTDIDKSGVVDVNDLKMFADTWLNPYSTLSMPWFDCWTRPYQCYGDVDGAASAGRYVGVSDLTIFNGIRYGRCYPCRYPSLFYNPCADFNRDFVINDNDANILQANFGKALTPCPACQ